MLRQRNKLKWYFNRPKIIIIVGVLVTVYFGINLAKEVMNRRQVDQQVRAYQEEITKLDKENREIADIITTWNTGGGLEREARLKLGLQKPDEKAVLIIDSRDTRQGEEIIKPGSEVIGGVVLPGVESDASNIKNWWNYFFN